MGDFPAQGKYRMSRAVCANQWNTIIGRVVSSSARWLIKGFRGNGLRCWILKSWFKMCCYLHFPRHTLVMLISSGISAFLLLSIYMWRVNTLFGVWFAAVCGLCCLGWVPHWGCLHARRSKLAHFASQGQLVWWVWVQYAASVVTNCVQVRNADRKSMMHLAI